MRNGKNGMFTRWTLSLTSAVVMVAGNPLWQPVYGQSLRPEMSITSPSAGLPPLVKGMINQTDELRSLDRTDRHRRSWKTLYCKPGDEFRWYYTWVTKEGGTVTKIEDAPIPGVQDDRPISQSHPNIYVGIVVSAACGSVVSGLLVAGTNLLYKHN